MWALVFPVQSLDAWMVSLYFSRVIYPCFCLLCASFLCLSFDRSILFIHAGFLSLLSNFPQVRMTCSWAWRKLFLKKNVSRGQKKRDSPIHVSCRQFLILPKPMRWGPNIDQHKQNKYWAGLLNLCFSLMSTALISYLLKDLAFLFSHPDTLTSSWQKLLDLLTNVFKVQKLMLVHVHTQTLLKHLFWIMTSGQFIEMFYSLSYSKWSSSFTSIIFRTFYEVERLAWNSLSLIHHFSNPFQQRQESHWVDK